MQFKDVLLELKVTPTITNDGRVFLNMNVKKDEVEGFVDTSIGQVPQINKREVNTAVLVEDGQTVVGIEARGFILAAPIAYLLGAGFVPVRKAGKLPWHTRVEEYSLEYGTDRLEMHHDGVAEGDNVLVVDDVLATGGTAAATLRLVEAAGGTVVGLGFVIELAFLGGRGRLGDHEAVSLLTYE